MYAGNRSKIESEKKKKKGEKEEKRRNRGLKHFLLLLFSFQSATYQLG